MPMLGFYGITKDPKTKEFIMIVQFANMGNLRSILLNNKILWKDKIYLLVDLIEYLKRLHKLGHCHKNLHSNNILLLEARYVLDLSELANKQKSDDKIYGTLPSIAPEILSGEPFSFASDIYSFGIIMAELSFRNPHFYDKKDDLNLSIDIWNGHKPEFGKGTPKFYKKLAYRCVNDNPNQRPTANELSDILYFWWHSVKFYKSYENVKKYGYYGKEIKKAFDKADKKIPIFANQEHLMEYKSQLISTSSKPINCKNCSYCNKLLIDVLWCDNCGPYCIIEGWTSENPDIDEFIKDTIYHTRNQIYPDFLEWVPFDKFTNIKQIGEGGFAKVYAAIWTDGKSKFEKQKNGSWKKLDSKPMKVALKRLIGSQNMSAERLNEVYIKCIKFLYDY